MHLFPLISLHRTHVNIYHCAKRLLIATTMLCSTMVASSQVYVPIDTANVSERLLKGQELDRIANSNLNEIKKLISGREESFIVKKFKSQAKELKLDIESGLYVFDHRFDSFVDSMYRLLCKHNPQIPTDYRFYVSRDISLNAASMGNKVFVIHLGAFYFLENEEEFAALMAHEISHQLQQHTIATLKKRYYADKVESHEQMDQIKSEKRNKSDRALERVRSMRYADEALKRQQELEADSMGYVLYRNASLPPYDYINSYRLMALYDSISPEGVQVDTYRKIFEFENFPFKESWMKKDDFSVYDYSKYKPHYDQDSLKSHPEVVQRMKKLQEIFPELKDSVASRDPGKQFDSLRTIAEFEQVPSLVIEEDYGLAIYVCLLRLQSEPNEAYYRTYLGNLFGKIYDARKAYKLNRYLDVIDPKSQSESYQQFLSFMWNLKISEIKAIAVHYTDKGS